MKRVLLILRVPIETAFGLLSMGSLLLLPRVFRPEGPLLFLAGWLGMPRHTNGAMLTQAELQHLNHGAMLIGLLIVTLLFLNGLLWFKDVFAMIRKLKARDT